MRSLVGSSVPEDPDAVTPVAYEAARLTTSMLSGRLKGFERVKKITVQRPVIFCTRPVLWHQSMLGCGVNICLLEVYV